MKGINPTQFARKLRKCTPAFAMVAMLLLCSFPAFAEGDGARFKLMRTLYPPKMVLKHATELNLTEEQATKIEAIVQESKGAMAPIKASLKREAAALEKLLSKDQVDEKAALKQAQSVMDLERQVKEQRLSMLIRVKNTLTPEQQAAIETERRERHENRQKRRQMRRQRGKFGKQTR